MRKKRRVEIQAQPVLLRPLDPALKMLRRKFIAVHWISAGLRIKRVQVQSMLAGNERKRLVQVRAQFGWRACFARIITGDSQPTAKGACPILKSAHVIALPAVE